MYMPEPTPCTKRQKVRWLKSVASAAPMHPTPMMTAPAMSMGRRPTIWLR